MLILFSAILEVPSSATAQDDARRIAQFVSFLKGLAGNGYDVQRLLNSCMKIHDVASCAISISQAQEHTQNKRVVLGRSITLSQLDVRSISLASRFCVENVADEFSPVNSYQTFHG